MQITLNKIIFLFCVLTLSLNAQIKEGETLNSIAATVGKQVITRAEVEAEVMTFKQMDPSNGFSDDELFNKVLDNW